MIIASSFSWLTILHVINILSIMVLIFYLVWYIADKKHSLFWGIYWFVITWGKYKSGVRWYIDNPIYIAYRVMVLILLLINITLIGQLMESDIFNRPHWLLYLSPFAWGCVLWTNYLHNKRVAK